MTQFYSCTKVIKRPLEIIETEPEGCAYAYVRSLTVLNFEFLHLFPASPINQHNLVLRYKYVEEVWSSIIIGFSTW